MEKISATVALIKAPISRAQEHRAEMPASAPRMHNTVFHMIAETTSRRQPTRFYQNDSPPMIVHDSWQTTKRITVETCKRNLR